MERESTNLLGFLCFNSADVDKSRRTKVNIHIGYSTPKELNVHFSEISTLAVTTRAGLQSGDM